ncbi:MAG: ROK family protein [Halobacteriota archaeon]|nr:ROK family protein [Halobacteriota archaeon]
MGKISYECTTIGIDLGGTKVATALVDGDGKILFSSRYPTNSGEGPERIVKDLIKVVERSQDEVGTIAEAIGVGVAGQVDKAGVVRSAPSLPFRNEPLQDRIEDELGIPTVVTNDVRVATYGEWKYGSGRGVEDLVVIFVGTGIGGGVVSGGRLLQGCTNTFGEIGHIPLVANGRKCRCKSRGCIEAYAGGWAIAERARDAVSENHLEGGTIIELAGGVEEVTSATVGDAYDRGDDLAGVIVVETGIYLGLGVVGIVNAFNPCCIVLGGGVIEGIPDIIGIVEKIVRENALTPNSEEVKFVKASLGDRAGVIGAAVMAREKMLVER